MNTSRTPLDFFGGGLGVGGGKLSFIFYILDFKFQTLYLFRIDTKSIDMKFLSKNAKYILLRI